MTDFIWSFFIVIRLYVMKSKVDLIKKKNKPVKVTTVQTNLLK